MVHKSSIPLYWRLRKSKYNLIGTKCLTCNNVFFPPRKLCPNCRRKGKIEDFQFSGKGSIETFTIIRTAPEGFEKMTPYAIAIIRLDEGTNISGYITGDINEIAILCAPGVTASGVVGEILSFVETFNIFCILDAPRDLKYLEEASLSPDLNGLSQLPGKCASKQAAIYFPWINVYDPVTTKNRATAPSGAIAGVYARVDNERGVHKAPANEVVRLATSLTYNLSDAEQETLNQKGMNVIRNFTDSGILIWGARTTITTSDAEWKYINVRRLFNMIEKSIHDGTAWAVFEPNNQVLWAALRRNVSAFLFRIYNSGALAGASSNEAFFVKCDTTTNPQENIDAGIVSVEIGIAPVKPAEFIVFKIAQIKPGATDLVAS